MIVRIARVKVGNRQAPYPDKTPPSKAGSCRFYRRSSGAMLASTRRPVQAIRFNTDPVCIAARHVTSYPGRLHVFKKSLPYADGVLRVGLLQDSVAGSTPAINIFKLLQCSNADDGVKVQHRGR